MKKRSRLTFLVALYLIFGSFVGVAQTRLPLGDIKKIFIYSYPSLPRESQVASITRELKKFGFSVVDDRSQADAILTGEEQREIVLHGDGSEPDKSIFNYWLSLPDGSRVWKHTVKFVSKSSPADDAAYAATKVAERLYRDREKSLKKASRS